MTDAPPADIPRLAEAAARIAAAFRTLPEDAAVAAIAAHINQFWAIPMRRGFLAVAPDLLAPRLQAVQKLVRPPAR
jgi:formate dehydrogenase subunit delta